MLAGVQDVCVFFCVCVFVRDCLWLSLRERDREGEAGLERWRRKSMRRRRSWGGVRLHTAFSATPARALVAMATGRAEAEPPSTYPIRVRARGEKKRGGERERESLREEVEEERWQDGEV